jgi:3-oxoacyl-[acyl-carrier protein] reductase
MNCLTSQERLEAVVRELNALGGGQAVGLSADVAEYSECARLFSYAEKNFGDVDVLVNNAAVSYVGLFHEMRPEDYSRVINVNLISVMNMCALALPPMLRRRGGAIINVSSVWGRRGASCEAAYSASKGGVNAFTRALAKEAGPSGVRVNAVSCGVIDTDMNAFLLSDEKTALIEEIPLCRFGLPGEVAEAALFLAGAGAAYITGAVIDVDGGY